MLNYKLRSYFSVFSVLGVGLIPGEESPNAQICNNIVSMVYIVICMVLLWQWVGLMHGTLSQSVCGVCDWLVWMLFLGCYVLLITVVEDTKRFLVANWLLPVVLLLGLGLLIENKYITSYLFNARPLLAVLVVLPACRFLLRFFVDGRLWTTVIAALVVVAIFGLFVAGVDPGIKSIGDGLWWALATVSTVGYGDVVPVSAAGRILGGVLVIVGLGVFVVITANFLSLVLRNESAGAGESKDYLREEMDKIAKNQATLQRTLMDLKKQINDIQKK